MHAAQREEFVQSVLVAEPSLRVGYFRLGLLVRLQLFGIDIPIVIQAFEVVSFLWRQGILFVVLLLLCWPRSRHDGLSDR